MKNSKKKPAPSVEDYKIREPRHEVSLAVRADIVKSPEDEILNYSEMGCRILSKTKFKKGELLRIDLSRPSKGIKMVKPVMKLGKVVWLKPGKKEITEYGIEFENLSPEEQTSSK